MHRSLIAEQNNFVDPAVTDREKSKRLLFLFQLDLLPGVKGQILESKGLRDNKQRRYVNKYLKMISWAFVIFLNLGMVYYILLFALNQTEYRQDAWFKSFLLWIIADVFIVSTMMVLFSHIYLPSFLMKDVSMTRNKIAETVRKFYKKLSDGNGDRRSDFDEKDQSTFNAPQYLFLSVKLAREVLHLKEAKLIMSYESIWPKQSYKRTFEVSSQYKFSIITFISKAVSIVLTLLISSLLTFPVGIQDVILHSVGTVFIGYIIMIHIQLYNIYPMLVVVPALILCVVGNFIFLTCREVSRRRLATVKVEAMPADWKEGRDGRVVSNNYKSRKRSVIEGITIANQVQQSFEENNGQSHSSSSSSMPSDLSSLFLFDESMEDSGSSVPSKISFPLSSDSSNAAIDELEPVDNNDWRGDGLREEVEASDRSVSEELGLEGSDDESSHNTEWRAVERPWDSWTNSYRSGTSTSYYDSETDGLLNQPINYISNDNEELIGISKSSSNSYLSDEGSSPISY